MIVLADLFCAAVDAMNAYKGGFYGNSGGDGMTRKIVIGAIVVGAIWGLLFALDRFMKKRRSAGDDERVLFNDLCAVHRLTANEKKRMQLIAKKAQIEPPEAVFVMPEVFDRIASADKDPSAWSTLRTRVFGEQEAA